MLYQKTKIFIFFLLVFLVIGISVYPTDDMPQVGSDKLGHLLAYAVLQVTGYIAFPEVRKFGYLTASLVLLGAALEGVQSLVSSRYASWLDLAANIGGVVAGTCAIAAVQTIRRYIRRFEH